MGAIVPPDLSVVVLTFERPALLARCLASIPDGVEIIVADDGTEPRLDDKLPDKVAHYFWQEDRGNRASTARNEGFKLATRPKVLFLDDDVILHPMALAAHSICLEMYDVSLGLLVKNRWEPYSDDRMLFYMRDEMVGWNWCWTANLAVRRTVMAVTNGFDAETFDGGHGFEDIDFARRAHLAQFRFHFNRLAMACHPDAHRFESGGEAIARNQARYEDKWADSGIHPGVMGFGND
jgi:glycosyltransferase involved in cell wall biosynthesis